MYTECLIQVFSTNRKILICSPIIIYKDNLHLYYKLSNIVYIQGVPGMLWDTLHKC